MSLYVCVMTFVYFIWFLIVEEFFLQLLAYTWEKENRKNMLAGRAVSANRGPVQDFQMVSPTPQVVIVAFVDFHNYTKVPFIIIRLRLSLPLPRGAHCTSHSMQRRTLTITHFAYIAQNEPPPWHGVPTSQPCNQRKTKNLCPNLYASECYSISKKVGALEAEPFELNVKIRRWTDWRIKAPLHQSV